MLEHVGIAVWSVCGEYVDAFCAGGDAGWREVFAGDGGRIR